MPYGLTDLRFLNSVRLQTIIETAASYLERMRPLTFLDRLDLKNCSDDELYGRFTARVLAADIIPDGQKANVYEAGQIEIITNQLPNIKIGQNLTQTQLNLLERLVAGAARAAEQDAMLDWERDFAVNLLAGVRERMNWLACMMMTDSLSYNRWGVQFAASWGMPANLKVTAGTLWSSDGGTTANVSATPISDLFAFDVIDAGGVGSNAGYGLGPFTRITMSGRAFDIMTSTTEFANKAGRAWGVAFQPTPGAIPTYDRPELLNLVGRILNKEVVIDDKTIREPKSDGTIPSTTRVLPQNMVLLDRVSNGPTEWDMGNGIVTESLVASLLGEPVLGDSPQLLSGASYGPQAYYTAQSFDLNPPGVNGWAVARAFPRKHIPESSAVLTIW